MIAAMVGRETVAGARAGGARGGRPVLEVRGLSLDVPGPPRLAPGARRRRLRGPRRRGAGHRRPARLGAHRDPRDALRRQRGTAQRCRPDRRASRSRSRSPRDARRLGIALVTEDRKAKGLHLDASIRDNVALPSLARLARFGIRSAARRGGDGERRGAPPRRALHRHRAGRGDALRRQPAEGRHRQVARHPAARAPARRADPRHRRRRQAGDLRPDARAGRRGAGHRDGQLRAAGAAAPRRPHPGHVARAGGPGCCRAPRPARKRSCTSPPRADHGRWPRDAASAPLAHQALLGAGRDLPDRRADLAGQLQGQQHLPLLRQPARRPAPGLDHRPHRHRHDRGDPDRRHRPLGRLDHGALLGGLRHAPDRARLDPAAAMGIPALAITVFVVLAARDPLPAPQRPPGGVARPSRVRAPSTRPGHGRAGRGRARSAPALALWFAPAAGRRPSSACSASCSSRPASG